MYLTRFQINSRRRGAHKLLASPQVMHAAVLAGFPEQDGRVLWRVDQTQTKTHLYIVSQQQPDLTHLVEQAGWPTTSTWDTRPYDRLLASLEAGQTWAFRITANPVHNGRSQKKNKDAPTQRFGHVTVNQQRDWLLSRVERCGIRVPDGASGEPDVVVHSRLTREFRRDGHRVALRMATYDGRLEITDPDALRETLVKGLGHGKAYGCGLLTLAPIQ